METSVISVIKQLLADLNAKKPTLIICGNALSEGTNVSSSKYRSPAAPLIIVFFLVF